MSASDSQNEHDSGTVSSEMPQPHQNRGFTRMYQCLCIAIMILSVCIACASVAQFYELKYHNANETAYYQYLLRAMEMKQTSNMSMLEACHQAIEHDHIQQLYKSANVDLAELEIDIESLKQTKAMNLKHPAESKKHELIMMCDMKLSSILSSETQSQQLQDSANKVAKASKTHRTAYQQFLEKATEAHRQNPKESILRVCIQSIDHADLQEVWKNAAVDMTVQVAVDEILREQNGDRTEADRKLYQKEKLVIMCEIEVTQIMREQKDALAAMERPAPDKEINLKVEPKQNVELTVNDNR